MTMTNAEWIIKTGHTFKQLRLIQHNELANRTYTVMLCDEPISELNDKKEPLDVFRRWLDAEHKEPILDDAEKKYLSAVIKPFRNKIYTIVKWRSYSGDSEWLSFISESKFGAFFLPNFKAGTMYKGMEVGRKYTLDELGI